MSSRLLWVMLVLRIQLHIKNLRLFAGICMAEWRKSLLMWL